MKRLLSIFGVLFSCTTIEPLTNEINCFDQIDEDLDGTIDCADTDCSEEPNCQPTFEICNDTLDNDQDGQADCLDSDCTFAQNCEEVNPEICDLGTGDEDEDGTENCQDSDCAASPFCGPEICDDGIDNNGNFAIDCAEANCVADPSCQGPQPEVCNDSIDNDEDNKIDCLDVDCVEAPECAGAVCNPNNDQCSGNDICLVNVCAAAFGRSYRFSGFTLQLSAIDRNGGNWDGTGNAPDPKVELHMNGSKFLETANKSNVFNATYSETANRAVNSGDVLEVRVLDVDDNADDLALSCFADPISTDLLRARTLSCQNTVGGNNIGTVTFSITPN